MKNLCNDKRGTLTKSGILLVLLVFYAVSFTFIGYINGYYNMTIGTQNVTSVHANLSFGQMMISGISDLPAWFNYIFFGSFVTLIGFILISSLPTFNGGS